ncbi:hypothetical protein Hanom_Chr03g00253531 [Helianthus anomalus]
MALFCLCSFDSFAAIQVNTRITLASCKPTFRSKTSAAQHNQIQHFGLVRSYI